MPSDDRPLPLAKRGREPATAATKIIVASLHRNGTRSIHQLFKNLGIRSLHHPGADDPRYIDAGRTALAEGRDMLDVLRPLLQKYDAFSDTPFNVMYQRLHQHWGDAKVIALFRNPWAWISSVRRHTGGREFGPYERVQYWSFFTGRPATIDSLSDLDLLHFYMSHYAGIIGYFRARAPDRLFIADLSAPRLGLEIARFLGYSASGDLAFPNVSDRV